MAEAPANEYITIARRRRSRQRPALMPCNKMNTLSVNCAIVAIATKLTISGNLLVWLGIPYSLEGGSLLVKIHPGSYLALLAFFFKLAACRFRIQDIFGLAVTLRGLSIFLTCMFACLLYAAALTGAGGLITLIDSFLPAGMIGVSLAGARRDQLHRLQHVLRALIVLNAMLALGEACAGLHLIKLPPMNVELPDDFRPTALYDHPLTGSMVTMLGLFLSSPRASPACEALANMILFAALMAFGGRMALLVFLLLVSGGYSLFLSRQMLRRRLTAHNVLPAAIMAAMCLPIAIAAIGAGLTGRLAGHFYWDSSAQSRIDQLRLFSMLTVEQVTFGCTRDTVLALIEPLRLGYDVNAIENFWLLMLASLGLLCFPLFLIGMAALTHFLWAVGDGRARLMTMSLISAASTSNSLGRKSILLAILVACVAASGRGWSVRRSTAQADHGAALSWRGA